MLFLPEAAGPHDPQLTSAPRLPNSIRRTSSIDTSWPDGFEGNAQVDARARDLLTSHDNADRVVGAQRLSLTVGGPFKPISAVESSPLEEGLDALVGATIGPGFRRKVSESLPEHRDANSLLFLLLDDLPGASLVSGYAMQRAGAYGGEPDPSKPLPVTSKMDDLCAGWAREGTMMVTIREKGSIPVPVGPLAPTIEPKDDPLSWHEMTDLPARSMRRRRCLDLIQDPNDDDVVELVAHFRDSYCDEDQIEHVVHEYSLAGSLNSKTGQVSSMSARAHVLPWMECPGALASAGRVEGMEFAELRDSVRRDFVGASTCTHLNDTLRSLADSELLLRELQSA